MSESNGGLLLQGVGSALLIALAGFLYLYGSYFKRFQLAHLSPQTRASLAFAYGLAIVLLASLFSQLSVNATQLIGTVWKTISPFPGVDGLFASAPVLGILLAVLENTLRLVSASDLSYLKQHSHPLHTYSLRSRMRIAALSDLARGTDDRLLWTLWRAITLGKLIQTTLKNGKVYIGSPLTSLDPSAPAGWLKIVPIESGYRDSDTQSYFRTTSYIDLFEAIANDTKPSTHPETQSRVAPSNNSEIEFDALDLGILVAWGEIVSLTIHEPALQSYFSRQTAPADAVPADEAAATDQTG